MTKQEQVLVVPTKKYNFKEGVTPGVQLLWQMMDDAYLIPRVDAEQDPSHKQLIPYIVFECDRPGIGRVFCYARRGDEKRLHGLQSIGIGGHINTTDVLRNVGREIREEVTITSPYILIFSGFINDNSTPVGQVHLGLFFHAILEQPKIQGLDGQLVPWSQLQDLELWSQHAVKFIKG